MSVIKTEHLTHLYSIGTPFEKAAINDVNIEISQGEFVGVIGHTGSGKSTLIQHFNGLLKPTSGKIYLDGKDIWADKSQIRSVRFQVGLVFQYPEYQLFEETVYKDIAFGPKNMGLSDDEVDLRVRESAALVGLKNDILNKSPFELSGGQKRTILLVSHSMEDIAKYASRVLVMNHAEVYAFDTVEKVFSRVQQLRSLGLDVPQITRIFYHLKAHGVDIDTNVYSVEHAKTLILEKLKKAGGEL